MSMLRRVRWGRALGVWLLIALVESVHGVLRQTFVAPQLGPGLTRPLGFVVGAALVLGVAVWTQPWLTASTRSAQLGVGALWLGLMLAFELLLGRAQGLSWQRIGAEFDPSQGGLMLFGLLVMLFAPMAAARLRRPAVAMPRSDAGV